MEWSFQKSAYRWFVISVLWLQLPLGLSAQGTGMQIQPFGTIPKALKSPKVTRNLFENAGLHFQTATSLRKGTAP